MIIKQVIEIEDISKIRDKLIALLEKDKNKLDDEEIKETKEELKINLIDWIIEEIYESFDFD